jgi:hypothetical protein
MPTSAGTGRCEALPIMKRKGTEAAIFWLVIIGPILIGLAGCIWYGGSRTPALWVGFVGVVLLLLTGALQLQQVITKSSTSPDVTMRLVGPKHPALILENISDTVAHQIKYALALLKIGSGLPVAIPIGTYDFLRPHDQGGPLNLFDSPAVLQTVHEGDKMFGWIQISCPLCLLTHYFYAYIDLGRAGWYAEVTKDRHEQIVKWLRDNGPYNTDDADRIVSVIPLERRINIQ